MSLAVHVLIVTDRSATVALLTNALEPEGYTVTSFLAESPFTGHAPAAAEGAPDPRPILALETIAAMRPLPDAIVLDLRSPDTQVAGNQFLRQIAHDPVLGLIPIILGTTASDGTAAAAPATGGGREVGQPDMVRVRSTPIDVDAVLEVLAQVLAP